jgi:DNA-binding HxlR family transcriptional regulator
MAELRDGQPQEWGGIWEALGCKWTFHIIRCLNRKPMQFNQLKEAVGGVPASTLSTRLKELQSQALVFRTVQDTTPPSTLYGLTEKGDAVADIVTQLEEIEEQFD